MNSSGENRLAVRLQKLFFMKLLSVKIQKLKKTQIEIIVGISVFVEDSKSLLPSLGRSANLSEPWAPRNDTGRSFVFVFTDILQHLAISSFYSLSFMRFFIQAYRVRVVSFRARSTPRRPQHNRKAGGGRAAPDALRGRRPSK